MPFAQYDHNSQTLSTYRTDYPFAIGILPGRTWRGWDFFNTHAFNTLREIVTVDAVAITNQETRCFLVREGVDDLLGSPLGVGVCGNVEMDKASPIVTEHDEDVEDTESDGRNRKEVAGGDVPDMIIQKCPPGLGRRFASADHVLGHSCFGHIVAQEKQFGQDSRCAPGWVFAGHAPNQVTNFALDAWASGLASPGFPSPIQFESPAISARGERAIPRKRDRVAATSGV